MKYLRIKVEFCDSARSLEAYNDLPDTIVKCVRMDKALAIESRDDPCLRKFHTWMCKYRGYTDDLTKEDHAALDNL